ncbi:MAG: ATP-binding cassette domain-containing protein [Pseudomonadota bacterium]
MIRTVPKLELDGIGQRYAKQIVFEGIHQTFGAGVHLLTGPSGVGKSTLLRLCATAERAASGVVRWNGTPLPRSRKALRRVLGYAPQSVDLPLDLTALEFLSHMAALKGLGRAGSHSLGLLEQLALGADASKRIMAFSGGMRRRLVLAQAFLGAPELLVLDEPTAELDGETAAQVASLVAARAEHTVVLLTTHLRAHFDSVPLAAYVVTERSLRPCS